MFALWRRWRRNRLLALPFPRGWQAAIHFHVVAYRRLSAPERRRLCELVRIFVAEKSWEGCGGLVVDDLVKAVIAAQACMLVLELGIDAFAGVDTIIVYPSHFMPRERPSHHGSVVRERSRPILGETSRRGPIVLSWDAVLAGAHDDGDGDNVVFHEFAHKLDMATGGADGVPPLRDLDTHRRWIAVFDRELERLRERTEHGEETCLDPYGAQSRSELFAVATEHFFEQPEFVELHHPAMYSLLAEFYRQDPVIRVRRRLGLTWCRRAAAFRASLPEPPTPTAILRDAWRGLAESLEPMWSPAAILWLAVALAFVLLGSDPQKQRLLPSPEPAVSAIRHR